jgi:hypothetical protein
MESIAEEGLLCLKSKRPRGTGPSGLQVVRMLGVGTIHSG